LTYRLTDAGSHRLKCDDLQSIGNLLLPSFGPRESPRVYHPSLLSVGAVEHATPTRWRVLSRAAYVGARWALPIVSPQLGVQTTPVAHTLPAYPRYKRDGLGRIIKTVDSMKRASGQDSHPFDCITYGAAVLLPVHERHERPSPRRDRPRSVGGRLAWMAH